MLDITRPAHTVGITSPPSHWPLRRLLHLELVIFFLQLEMELSVCSVRLGAHALEGVYGTYT